MRDQRIKSWLQSYASYNVRSNKGYALEAFLWDQNLTVGELFGLPDNAIVAAVTKVVHSYVEEEEDPSQGRGDGSSRGRTPG